ncbi:MAG: MFS transporter [Deltaproteobacteria bacterium]|nr:MFS transporter [Deltaproteobacteria bacterium]
MDTAQASFREGTVAFAALRHRDFRGYFVTSMLSMMADNIEHVISYWVIFQLFHSRVLAGFAVISHWIPFLFLSMYSGALADRFDCRRLIQISQLGFMGVTLAWGVLFITGNLQVWHTVALLIVHGLAGTLWEPAGQLILHDLVGPEHLQSAVRLNATGRQLGILLGPAVGGGLMLILSPSAGLMVNALIYLPLIVWLQTVPYTGHSRTALEGVKGRRLGWRDAMRVLGGVSGNRVILSMVLLAGFSSLFVGNAFLAHMPEFAQDLGSDQAGFGYSALLVANGAGAVIGGLMLEGRGLLKARGRTAIVLAILWCLVIGGFATASTYPLALVLLLLAGIFNLAFYAMAQTLVQLLAPAHLRGRLIGLFSMSGLGFRTFSGVTVGMLGSLIGIHWSLGLSSAVLLAVTCALLGFMGSSGREACHNAAGFTPR